MANSLTELTTVQQLVVRNARAAAGKSSGQSRDGGIWWTDCWDGKQPHPTDGDRMRAAIRDYDTWYKQISWPARTGPVLVPHVPQSIRQQTVLVPASQSIWQKMLGSFNQSKYACDHQRMLVNRIISVYNPSVAVPKEGDDTATLSFLGIRRQCLEWVDYIATISGGQARNYTSSSACVSDPAKFRPGMALFDPSAPHAMIITNITRDSAGNPTFEVAEANWELGHWSNPNGQVPWERTVRVRSHPVSYSSRYRVVTVELATPG